MTVSTSLLATGSQIASIHPLITQIVVPSTQADAWLDRAIRIPHAIWVGTLANNFRAIALALFQHLYEGGHQPRIVSGWRHPATQRRLKEQNRSQVDVSKHNVFKIVNGYPVASSLAVDILSLKGGYTDQTNPAASIAMYRAMGVWIKNYNAALPAEDPMRLTWGGNYKKTNSYLAQHGLGWDPRHVELNTMSMNQVAIETARNLLAIRADAPRYFLSDVDLNEAHNEGSISVAPQTTLTPKASRDQYEAIRDTIRTKSPDVSSSGLIPLGALVGGMLSLTALTASAALYTARKNKR